MRTKGKDFVEINNAMEKMILTGAQRPFVYA